MRKGVNKTEIGEHAGLGQHKNVPFLCDPFAKRFHNEPCRSQLDTRYFAFINIAYKF